MFAKTTLAALALSLAGLSAASASTVSKQQVTRIDAFGNRITKTRVVRTNDFGDRVSATRVSRTDLFGNRVSAIRVSRTDAFGERGPDVRSNEFLGLASEHLAGATIDVRVPTAVIERDECIGHALQNRGATTIGALTRLFFALAVGDVDVGAEHSDRRTGRVVHE